MKQFKQIFFYILIILCVLSSYYIYGKSIEQYYINETNQTVSTNFYKIPLSYLLPLIVVFILVLYKFKNYVIEKREKEICSQIELINNGHYQNLEHSNNLNIYLNNLNKYVDFQKKEAMSIKKQMKSYIEDIAHQIKTPLTTLHIYVETSSDTNIQTYGQKELLRVEEVVDEMIRLAKLEAHAIRFKFSNVFLNEIFEQVLFDLNPLIQSKEIEINLTYTDRQICVDEMWICEMLINILKNSIEFSNEHSVIHIIVKEVTNKLIIEISDHGVGFIKEEIPYIFDRFHKSDTNDIRKQKGMGIGLSIANEVIKAHHGNIYVTNNKTGGAKFILELPIILGKKKI